MKPPDRRLEDIARAFLWERDRIEDEYASRPPRPIPFNNTLLTPEQRVQLQELAQSDHDIAMAEEIADAHRESMRECEAVKARIDKEQLR